MTVKILHTSDWHLGARIGRLDRADDAFARITQLATKIDEENVDLLLVAGDIFDETRSAQLAVLVQRLSEVLAPRVHDGLRAVFLAGNHDREHVFPLLQAASDLFGPDLAQRVTFVHRPRVLAVPDRSGGNAIALVCLPYPTLFRYGLEAHGWPSRDVRHRELAEAVRHRMIELEAEAARDHAGLAKVMTGHFLVRGAEIGHGVYCLSENEDIPVERGDLPPWDYVALGHIHKPQEMGPNMLYSGSIERMDLGEASDRKSAVLVDINGPGAAGWETFGLDATPFAAFEASSEEELQTHRNSLDDPEHTLVSLRLNIDGVASVASLIARAHELFPRLYREPEILRSPLPGGTLTPGGFDRSDVAGTVRSFLRDRLGDTNDAEGVIDLADELIASEAFEAALAQDRNPEGAGS